MVTRKQVEQAILDADKSNPEFATAVAQARGDAELASALDKALTGFRAQILEFEEGDLKFASPRQPKRTESSVRTAIKAIESFRSQA